MILKKLNTIVSKSLITFTLLLLVIIYSFFQSENFLVSLINNTFLLGLALLLFAGSSAVFLSGSLNIFLAGFSKKIRSEMFDRVKIENRKKEKEENPDADINDSLIKKYEQEQAELSKLKKSVFVQFPLIVGASLVVFSFLLLYIAG